MYTRILIAALVAALLSASLAAQTPSPAVDPAATPAVAAESETPAAAFSTTTDPAALLAEVSTAQPGDAEAGAGKSAACGACHGMDGNSADPQYPKLAGQHERYIARELAMFKSGARPNPIMQGFAAPLSAQDMRDLGAYFATQKVVAGIADESPISNEYSPYKGQRIVDIGRGIYQGGIQDKQVPACMACHGPTGVGNPGPSYPSLGGQHAGYTAAMLKKYQSTAPADPMLKDGNYAIMAAVAQRLSEEEILALSSFIEGLHERPPVMVKPAP